MEQEMNNQEVVEAERGLLNYKTGQASQLPSETFRRNSGPNSSSPRFDVQLMHNRLPKVVVNIQGRSTSVQTPSPVPKNPLRSQQLQEILEPLHLSLWREESEHGFANPTVATTQIRQSLIGLSPEAEVLSLPNLHMRIQELVEGRAQTIIPSTQQVLQRIRRQFIKRQTLEQDLEFLKPHGTRRLSTILESATRLEASVKLNKKTWMFKPRNGGTAKDKLDAQIKFRNQLRNHYPPNESEQLECRTDQMDVDELENLPSMEQSSQSSESSLASNIQVHTRNTSKQPAQPSAEFVLNKNGKVAGADDPKDKTGGEASIMPPPGIPSNSSPDLVGDIVSDGGESMGKKPVRTKAQLKHVPRKKSSKHNVLVLERKCKIRPGTLFKCRRTKEKFTFTTVHRTITGPGLALLAAASALRSRSIQSEIQQGFQRTSRASWKVGPTAELPNYQLPSSVQPNTGLRECGRVRVNSGIGIGPIDVQLNSSTSSVENSQQTTGNCSCSSKSSKPRTTQRKGNRKPERFTSRKSSIQNPSMVLVNRYMQHLQATNPETVEYPPPDGTFDHTIELLAYTRELERKIHLFKTEGVLVNIGHRPERKVYLTEPLGEDFVPTVPLEKKSVKEALDQGVCDFLAHAGFTQAPLPMVEMLSDILENYYGAFASKLKAVVEREVAGVSHGFLDPMDRVTAELGLGNVRGLGDFYEQSVIGYHKTVEQNLEKLENKLGTLLAYKGLESHIRDRMPWGTDEQRQLVFERAKARLHRTNRLVPKPPH